MKKTDVLKVSLFNLSKRKIRSTILIIILGMFVFFLYSCSSIMLSTYSNLKKTYFNFFGDNLSVRIEEIDDYDKMFKIIDKYDDIVDSSNTSVHGFYLTDFKTNKDYKEFSNTNSCLVSDRSIEIGSKYIINYDDNEYEFNVIGYTNSFKSQYVLRYFNNNIKKIEKLNVHLKVNKGNMNKTIDFYKAMDKISGDFEGYKIESYMNSYNKYFIFSVIFSSIVLIFSIVFFISIVNFSYGSFFDDSEFFSMLRVLGNDSKDEKNIEIFEFSILYSFGFMFSVFLIIIFDSALKNINKTLIENIIDKELIYNNEVREPVNNLTRLWYVCPFIVILLVLLSLLIVKIKKKALDSSYSSIFSGVEK